MACAGAELPPRATLVTWGQMGVLGSDGQVAHHLRYRAQLSRQREVGFCTLIKYCTQHRIAICPQLFYTTPVDQAATVVRRPRRADQIVSFPR